MPYFDSADRSSGRHADSVTMYQPPPIEIPTGNHHPVWADLYAPRGAGDDIALERAVILCHGMKGYRLWGFIPRLARRLRSVGLAALAIDFSHNGVAGGDGGASGGPVYGEPHMIKRNTIDRERRDLAAAIDWIRSGAGGRFAAGVRVGLWGHSRGGTSVLLNALDHPAAVAAIATWSAPAHADIYRPAQKRRWREAGEYEWLEGESGQRLSMGVCFLDDLEARHEEYDLAARSTALEVPHLIVHGEHDLVIPVDHAERLAAERRSGVETETLILRTGHTYGIGRSADPVALRTAVDRTVGWFERHVLASGDSK